MVKRSLRAHPPLHGESGVELDLHSWRRVGGDEKTARTGLVHVVACNDPVKVMKVCSSLQQGEGQTTNEW